MKSEVPPGLLAPVIAAFELENLIGQIVPGSFPMGIPFLLLSSKLNLPGMAKDNRLNLGNRKTGHVEPSCDST